MKNEVTFRSARYSGVPDRRGPPLWHELFPAEQARVLQLLVERVEVYQHALDLHLRVDGLQTLVADLRAGKTERRAA